TVHDLRVALRRCRSLADGFRPIDPDKNWKKMRRQGSALFDSLGELRDCHVMQHWVEQLGIETDPATQKLTTHCRQQEKIFEQHANQARETFDSKRWDSLAAVLSRRSARLQPGSAPFQALALERWTKARKLESPALRSGSPAALHKLRIAIKKFRYVVENFLPQHKEEWTESLKSAQDLLGEIHDLDVLIETARNIGALDAPESQERWQALIRNERDLRMERYKNLMLGPDSAWQVWRSGLPRGRQSREASLTRLQAWSGFLDSDVRHTHRVTRFALKLFDGLVNCQVIRGEHARSRDLLHAAAVVHEVGRAEQKNKHHKRTEKMVASISHLPGWSRSEVEIIARIARYHRGALPGNAVLRDFPPEHRQTVLLLSGVLRLANALDADHNGIIRGVMVCCSSETVLIYAQGFQPQGEIAETIAAARYLLEMTCGRAVIVRPAPPKRQHVIRVRSRRRTAARQEITART
ncbi:MAG TPA: CHAD domain-containing protein, partial [Candidatus Angelobacter sp.]|nr:CHAD domain-containing protein [Candidatus Angelobacter sp.]